MNWIDEIAGEYRDKKELEKQKDDLIKRADYWGDLKRQVERDVEQINSHPVWQDQLKDNPLTINFLNGSYEITGGNFPKISVEVFNEYDDIEIIRKIREKPESQIKERKEVFTVNSDGKQIFLQGDNAILHIPKQASKYILSPFVESLCGESSI